MPAYHHIPHSLFKRQSVALFGPIMIGSDLTFFLRLRLHCIELGTSCAVFRAPSSGGSSLITAVHGSLHLSNLPWPGRSEGGNSLSSTAPPQASGAILTPLQSLGYLRSAASWPGSTAVLHCPTQQGGLALGTSWHLHCNELELLSRGWLAGYAIVLLGLYVHLCGSIDRHRVSLARLYEGSSYIKLQSYRLPMILMILGENTTRAQPAKARNYTKTTNALCSSEPTALLSTIPSHCHKHLDC
ncbi:hypothetical protein CONLIGDRAFT_7813 [Coniochaeta ligniaria NRRL 30616]|uniref:Uncharacterized protein n=1 Tax=Coniochaeta ligniaria NRRL 30616 TaxID=1408157 RepID=A0A1J7J566_9PEZI|nr:hypothetical protein CONLIGDRAFT_7813 [Coniochaeta ligniaria NRRL 30616]